VQSEEASFRDLHSEMIENSHSEKTAEKDSAAPTRAPGKRADKTSAQLGKSDASELVLPIAVTAGRQNTLPLRFSSLFLPVLQPAAAPRQASETLSANAAAPVDPKQISGKENATLTAAEDAQPSNPEPVALPSVLSDDAPAANTADQGDVAFAARLTAAVIPAQTVVGATEPAPGEPSRPKAVSPSAAPQTYMAADSQTSSDPAKSVAQQFAKPDSALTIATTSVTTIPVTTPAKEFVSNSKAPVPADVAKPANEATLETSPIATTSSHDIRVRVSDNQGGTLDVRFLDLGSEVRVSVRTPDNNLAQSLRGNLTELSQHLSVGGINSEMWRPGSGSSLFQGSSQQSPDSDSNSNQSGHGAGREAKQGNPQQQPKQDQPRWLQEFESSTAQIQPQGN
jgi:hypothetical protein